MKLFVWNRPVAVSYGGTCLYIIAANVQEARKLAKKVALSEYGHLPNGKTVDLAGVIGSPDRIHSLPYAEMYRWEE